MTNERDYLQVSSIQEICIQIQHKKEPVYHLNNFYKEEERIIIQQTDNEWPDEIHEKAYWFRKYFVGKPYITLIGPFLENDNDFAIFSIIREVVSKTQSQFRIIVRTKQVYIQYSTLR